MSKNLIEKVMRDGAWHTTHIGMLQDQIDFIKFLNGGKPLLSSEWVSLFVHEYDRSWIISLIHDRYSVFNLFSLHNYFVNNRNTPETDDFVSILKKAIIQNMAPEELRNHISHTRRNFYSMMQYSENTYYHLRHRLTLFTDEELGFATRLYREYLNE